MKKTTVSLLLCLFAAPLAMADLTVLYKGATPSLGVDVYSSDGHKGTVVAGQYRIEVGGATGDIIGAPGVIDAFCIDIDDWAPTSTARSYTLTTLDGAPDYTSGPMGSKRAGYLATLLNRYWDVGDWVSAESRTFSSVTYSQSKVAAAVQVAVWEIVDEFNTNKFGCEPDADIKPGDWNVTTGIFKIVGNTDVGKIANEMLSTVVGFGPSSLGNYAAVSNHATDSYYQDYVVRVPVPAAALLGMLGLSVAGLRLRKRLA